MESPPAPAADAMLDVVSALSLAEQAMLWKALGEQMLATLETYRDAEGDIPEQLEADRRVVENAAAVVGEGARLAETLVHSMAATHHEVVHRLDSSVGEDAMFRPGEFAADDLAVRLRRSSYGVRLMATETGELSRKHPVLWKRCGTGEGVTRSAVVMMKEMAHLDEAQRVSVEEAALQREIHRSWPRTARRRMRQLLAELGLDKPASVEDLDRTKCLFFSEHPDQPRLTDLFVTMDADQAWILRQAIDEHACRLQAERHTAVAAKTDVVSRAAAAYPMRLARVDAFVELALQHVRCLPEVTLTVPVTPRGQEGEPAEGDRAGMHVPNIGLIDPAIVERLTKTIGAKVRVNLQDAEEGVTLWSSTASYQPTAAMRRMVVERDRHCRFPGCTKPGSVCDVDHVIPYARGGPTSPHNLQLLCRHHHRAKTSGAWSVVMNPRGECVWRSPTGQCYRTMPDDPTPYSRPPGSEPLAA